MKRLVLMILLILFSVNLAYAYRMEIWVKRPDNSLELTKQCTSTNANFECRHTYCCFGKPPGTYSAQAKTFYDDNGNNLASQSNWESFTCNLPPQVISVTPNSGLYYNTNTLTFRTVYRDEAGANDIQRVYFAISPPNYGNDPSGNNEEAYCQSFEGNLSYYFGAVYYPSSRTFKVASIDTGGCPWSTTNTNKPGTAKLLSVSHTTSANDLIVNWTIQFTSFDTGDKNLYLMANDSLNQGNGASSGDICLISGGGFVWEKKGQITFFSKTNCELCGYFSSQNECNEACSVLCEPASCFNIPNCYKCPGTTTPPTTTTTPSGCNSDKDCPCYANCINHVCVDFRSLLGGCNYYDNCPGNKDCCDITTYGSQNYGCNQEYCYNVAEDICEDPYYVCHGYISNCGIGAVGG
jgi:hypothetical protein